MKQSILISMLIVLPIVGAENKLASADAAQPDNKEEQPRRDSQEYVFPMTTADSCENGGKPDEYLLAQPITLPDKDALSKLASQSNADMKFIFEQNKVADEFAGKKYDTAVALRDAVLRWWLLKEGRAYSRLVDPHTIPLSLIQILLDNPEIFKVIKEKYPV